MPKLESLRSGEYSPNIQDRRGYEWGSRPVRELLSSGLGMYLGGTRTGATMLGLYPPQNAGVLENQLGLGDIPSASLGAQAIGMARKLPEYFSQYVLGNDPTKSLLGEALIRHGKSRLNEINLREGMGGKLWNEMTEQEKIDWLTAKGFTHGSAR